MIKEKYKQLFLYLQFSGVRTITIHKRCAQPKKNTSTQMDLETNIRRLINSKREDDYWDFKEEPHDNNAELLHDILCLANSLHKGERFLIFGVTDPKEGTKIKGLTQNQRNRKTQVQYIDFLRSKPFAGDCRPEIELQTLILDNLEIDVLIIFDNPLKPYYLTEDYKLKPQNNKETVVRANYIY